MCHLQSRNSCGAMVPSHLCPVFGSFGADQPPWPDKHTPPPLAISLLPACLSLCQMLYEELDVPEWSCPCFKGGKTEVQRCGVCLTSRIIRVGEKGFEPRSFMCFLCNDFAHHWPHLPGGDVTIEHKYCHLLAFQQISALSQGSSNCCLALILWPQCGCCWVSCCFSRREATAVLPKAEVQRGGCRWVMHGSLEPTSLAGWADQ